MVQQVLRTVKKNQSSEDKFASHITLKQKMNHINNSIPREYQVATPKSPSDLQRPDLTDVVSAPQLGNNMINNTLSNTHSVIISTRDSEDIERLKYETAKNELLDKLNLHILLSYKKSDKIKKELSRVHAQMKLMNKLHDDEELLNKIEKYNRNNLKRSNETLNRQHSVTFVENSMSPQTQSQTPKHHYHTRSKSQGNILDDSFWRDCIDDPILTSRTNKIINPNEKHYFSDRMNSESTPNLYTIQPNNSKTPTDYNNHPVFKRKDGILVLLTCSVCGRQGFMTVKGITSHIKIKHGNIYENPKIAVLMNQWLLPDEYQDSLILTKFKDLNIDPKIMYLPLENENRTKKTNTKGITQLTRSNSNSNSNPSKNQLHTTSRHHQCNEENYNIDHLKNFCNKDELSSLINMVKTSKQDLDVILQQPTDTESDSDDEIELQIDVKTPDTANDGDYESPNSPLSSNCSSPADALSMDNFPSVSKSSSPPITTIPLRRMNLRKRKQEEDSDGDDAIPLKERLRPSEKKARPDVIALSKLPEHERRSKHYNLRARSKLRSSSVEEDF
ncbi:protein Ahc1p [Monosporozyma servazzii]